MTPCVSSLWTVVTFCFILRIRAASTVFTQSLHFLRDKNFDNSKVTNDDDRLVLFTPSLVGCANACALRDWCTSFFYTEASDECCLHATVFVLPFLAQASGSPGTKYYKNDVPWCPPEDNLLYNRPAEMCMYFEGQDPSTWIAANDTCNVWDMTLATNLTPLKMDALLNITKKNNGMDNDIFIGLHRFPPGSQDLTWLNGEVLNESFFDPYWKSGQPSGGGVDDCVIIKADKSELDDVACDVPRKFVCEMLEPTPGT